jgi:hypothetical protein
MKKSAKISQQNNISQDCYNKEIRENITTKQYCTGLFQLSIKKSAKISQKISDNKLLDKKNITGKVAINDSKR